jgi:hypothetical protein
MNSHFNGTQCVPWAVDRIDSFEGLFTVHYVGGERMEIQRYRE